LASFPSATIGPLSARCTASFTEIKNIKTRSKTDFRVLPYAPDFEMEELCQLATEVNALIRFATVVGASPRFTTRLRLVSYCHIMEADFPYAVLYNLLRVIDRRAACWTLYERNGDDEVCEDRKGRRIVCQYPGQKIDQLARLSKELRMSIGHILRRMWRKDMRNAFSHAQYYLHDNGDFVGTKEISPISHDGGPGQGKTVSVSTEEIAAVHRAAERYLSSFIRAYKSSIEPFQDGLPHRIESVQVQWDNTRGIWLWAQ